MKSVMQNLQTRKLGRAEDGLALRNTRSARSVTDVDTPREELESRRVVRRVRRCRQRCRANTYTGRAERLTTGTTSARYRLRSSSRLGKWLEYSSEKGNHLKVLIADDSATLRERLVEMLSQVRGVEIVGEAGSVREACQALRELQPDLIVLDLQMRDGTGIEVLRDAKQNSPQTKVIIFTNQPEAQYRQRCIALGADYFLSKSTDSKFLLEINEELASEGPRQ